MPLPYSTQNEIAELSGCLRWDFQQVRIGPQCLSCNKVNTMSPSIGFALPGIELEGHGIVIILSVSVCFGSATLKRLLAWWPNAEVLNT